MTTISNVTLSTRQLLCKKYNNQLRITIKENELKMSKTFVVFHVLLARKRLLPTNFCYLVTKNLYLVARWCPQKKVNFRLYISIYMYHVQITTYLVTLQFSSLTSCSCLINERCFFILRIVRGRRWIHLFGKVVGWSVWCHPAK